MSSVLHPVGPEPPQTYWVRRAVVIGAAILAVIIVVAVVVSQSSGSVVAQPTPTPTTAGTFGPPSYVSTPAASPTASPTPSRSSSASRSTASAQPGTSATSATSDLSPKASGPLSCPANQLRATITGDQDLVPGQPTTVSISLINGSRATCTVKVGEDNFELRVYSGVDRIWSSKDCSTAVKAIAKTLAKDQAVGWKMTWDGRRSKNDCKQRPEIPNPGTYFATAQYAGAEPIQLRMTLRG